MSNEDIKNAQVRAGEQAVRERLRVKGLLSDPEPDPVKNDNTPVWELVIADMQERDRVGEQRYGVRLQANNGRDALVDAYQEGMDLVVYLRQVLEERICGDMAMLRSDEPSKIVACAYKHGHEGNHSWLFLRELVTLADSIILKVEPVQMVLHCPRCGAQHIDKAVTRCKKFEGLTENDRCGFEEGHVQPCKWLVSPVLEWDNPPHKSHLCAKCKCIWRPADVSTVGVEAIATRGEKDTWP